MKHFGTAYWRSIRRVPLAPGLLSYPRRDHAMVAAGRAAVAVGVPLCLLTLLRQPALAALTPYGAFTAMYGRGQPYRQRAVVMACAGVGLTLAMTIGGLLAVTRTNHWLAAVVIGGCGFAATLMLDAVRSGPPGGFILVLTMLSASALPLTWSRLPEAIAITAVTALFGWLLIMSGRLLRPDGPVRITVAVALESVARHAAAPDSPRLRHQAALAIEQAWAALAPGADRLAALVVRAETVFVSGSAAHISGSAARGTVSAARSASGTAPSTASATLATSSAAHSPGGAAPSAGSGALSMGGAALGVSNAVRELTVLARRARGFGPVPEVLTTITERRELLGRRPAPAQRWVALRPGSPEVLRALRSGTGIVLAYWAALAFGLGHAYWAALAAAAALQAINVATAVQRAIHRALGTVLGVFLAAAILAAHLPALGLAGVAAGAILVIEAVIASNYAVALVFITTLIPVLQSMAAPVVMVPVLFDRVVATTLGALVGVLCALVIVNSRYAILLASALSRCEQALRELNVHRAMSATAQLPNDRKRLRASLLALRDTFDLAAGEPSHVDIQAERVLAVERAGYQLLLGTDGAVPGRTREKSRISKP